MSSSKYQIKEHIVPCQHIRQFAHATLGSQEDVLHLAVKQYTPLDNLEPSPGDLTIIGAHANGFPKELYEPLWDEIHSLAKSSGFRIRNIWIADVAHQGISSVLNESKLGNDPSWFDHPRDLLGMINYFRAEMKRPFVGIGHSMGGNNLVNVALMHPRLFQSLILIDPVIARFTSPRGNITPAQASAVRRDKWPSRKIALQSFKKNKFYQTWDPRVLDLWVEYGLRELPTKVYPDVPPAVEPYDPDGHEVTLTTTKHQEVFTFLRPTDDSFKGSLNGFSETEKKELHKLLHPELDNIWEKGVGLYRPEPVITFSNLPHLRPSVLYIFGELSPLSTRETRNDKMTVTGTGTGGSGGAEAGRVKDVMVKDTGHLIPMEKVGETAQYCSDWIASELQRFNKNEELLQRFRDSQPENERFTLSKKLLGKFRSDLEASRKQNRKESKI